MRTTDSTIKTPGVHFKSYPIKYMLRFNRKELNEAAKRFALEVLGEEQYKSNKDAVREISENFKAGASWAREEFNAAATRQMLA